MKNVCIVVRNKRDPYYGEEFGPAASALADGGFPADKIFLSDGADAHEFAQTVIECKNFFDNTFVLAADAELDALRGKLCELVKCPPSAGVALEAGAKQYMFPAADGVVLGVDINAQVMTVDSRRLSEVMVEQ